MVSKDHEPFDLIGGGYKIHQLEGLEAGNIESAFTGYVSEVLGKVNVGKEATIYLCRTDDTLLQRGVVSEPYIAAKIYRARQFRNFDNDHSYRSFDKMRDRRLAKSMRGKSKRGQRAFHNHWIDSEWRNLKRMFDLGISVPRPYLHSADGILMSYIGNESGPTPLLVNCRLDEAVAARLLESILADVVLMVENNLIHGDFSAYNILFDGSKHTIIDVPQAVDARVSQDACNLFQRDLINIDKYFSRYGLSVPVEAMMRKYF